MFGAEIPSYPTQHRQSKQYQRRRFLDIRRALSGLSLCSRHLRLLHELNKLSQRYSIKLSPTKSLVTARLSPFVLRDDYYERAYYYPHVDWQFKIYRENNGIVVRHFFLKTPMPHPHIDHQRIFDCFGNQKAFFQKAVANMELSHAAELILNTLRTYTDQDSVFTTTMLRRKYQAFLQSEVPYNFSDTDIIDKKLGGVL